MAYPIFCYDNMFESGTVTVSTEETDFDKENAFDWRTDDWWKPTAGGTSWIKVDMGSAQSADYGMIFGHDLHTQTATIKLQYSTDDAAWTTAFTETPTDGSPIIVPFTTQSKRYWRFEITGADAAQSIGVVAVGERLTMPEGLRPGFMPPAMARVPEYLTNRAEAGAFIGRRIKRKGVKFKVDFQMLLPSWVEANWPAFQDHFETKPFGFLWDSDGHPDDAVFCWTDGKVPSPRYQQPLFMQVSLPLRGMIE